MRACPVAGFLAALLFAPLPVLAQQRRSAAVGPPEAYQHARDLASAGRDESALAILSRLAIRGAVAVFEAGSDSAFRRLVVRPEFGPISAAMRGPGAPSPTARRRSSCPSGT